MIRGVVLGIAANTKIGEKAGKVTMAISIPIRRLPVRREVSGFS